MRVGDLMTSTVVTIRENDSLERAVQMMLWAGIRHLPVVRERAVVGVVSEGTVLRRQTLSGRTPSSISVGEAMTQPARLAAPDMDTETAAATMVEAGIGCLPVVQGGNLVGILTRSDLLAQTAGVAIPAGPGHIRVSQVMNATPIVAKGDDYLLDAAASMVQYNIRHLPIVDGEGRIIGILSDRDVRTAVGDPRRALDDQEASTRVRSLKVWAAMVTSPITVSPHTSLSDAVAHFVDGRIGAVPVVDEGARPVGMFSYVDALRAFDERFRAFER